MKLRGYDLRTRRPRNAVQGRLALTQVVSAHPAHLNFQCVMLITPRMQNLRGIFADADVIARRKVR